MTCSILRRMGAVTASATAELDLASLRLWKSTRQKVAMAVVGAASLLSSSFLLMANRSIKS